MDLGTGTHVTQEFLGEFVQRYGDAWRSGDPARIVAECTADTVWQVPGVAGSLVGRVAVAEWLGSLFRMVPDAQFDYPVGPPFASADGTAAAARFRLKGTMRGPMEPPGFAATDSPIVDEGVEVYEQFRDGRLARCTIVFDALHVARQIGAAPAAGSRAERIGVFMQRVQARTMRRSARRTAQAAGPVS